MPKLLAMVVLFLSSASFASEGQAFKIVGNSKFNGQKWGASIIALGGQKAEVRNTSEGEGMTFDAVVTEIQGDKIALDYHFKVLRDGKAIEIAKTAVQTKVGSTERNFLRDSTGNELEFEITATRK